MLAFKTESDFRYDTLLSTGSDILCSIIKSNNEI